MRLIVNGEALETEAQTVEALLAALDLGGKPVAVEVNRQVIPKRKHASRQLSDGDVIEMVTLVGGG